MNKKLIAGLLGLGLILGPGAGLMIDKSYATEEAKDPVKEKEEQLKALINKPHDRLDPVWIVSENLRNRWNRQVDDARNALEREEKSEASLDSLIKSLEKLQKDIEDEADKVKKDYLKALAKSKKLIEKHSDKLNESEMNRIKNLKDSRDNYIVYLGKYFYGSELGYDWSLPISNLNNAIKYAQEFVVDSSDIEVTDNDIISVKQEIIDNFVNFEKLKDDRTRLENDYTVTIKTQAYKEANGEVKKSYDEAYENLRSIDKNIEDFDVLYDAAKKLYDVRLKITEKDLPKFDVLSIENIRLSESNLPDNSSKDDKVDGKTGDSSPTPKENYQLKLDSLKDSQDELEKNLLDKSLDGNKKEEINSQIEIISNLLNELKAKEKLTEEDENIIKKTNNKTGEIISSYKKSNDIDLSKLKKEKAKADRLEQSIFYVIRNGDAKRKFDAAYKAASDLIKGSNKEVKSQKEVDKLTEELERARKEMDFAIDSLDDKDLVKKKLNILSALDKNIRSYIDDNKVKLDEIDSGLVKKYEKAYKDAKDLRDYTDYEKVKKTYISLYKAVDGLDLNKERNRFDSLSILVDEAEEIEKSDFYKNLPQDKQILQTSYKALIKEASDMVKEKKADKAEVSKLSDHIEATKKAIKGDLGFFDWFIRHEIYLEDKVKAQDKYKKIKDLAENEKDEAKKALYKNAITDYDDLIGKVKNSDKYPRPEFDILAKRLENTREFLTDEKVGEDLYRLRKSYLDIIEIENHRAFDLLEDNSKVKIKNARASIKDSINKKDEKGQVDKGLEKLAKAYELPELKSIKALMDKDYPEDSKIFDLNNLLLKYGDLDKERKYTKAQAEYRKKFEEKLKTAKDLVAGGRTDEGQIGKVYKDFKESIDNLDGDKFEQASFALADKFEKNKDKIKDPDKRKNIAERINSLTKDGSKTMDDLLAIERDLDKLIEEGKSTLAKLISNPTTKDVKTTSVPVSDNKNSGISVKTGVESIVKVIGIGAIAAIILFFVNRKGDKNETNK